MNSVSREIYEVFDKYGKLLASQPYPLGAEVRLILDTEEGVYGTKKNVKLGKLKWSDIVKMADGHMGTYKTGMVARVVSQTPYCQQCLQEGVEFRAMLDDMAMIIGPEAVIVNMTNPNKRKAAAEMAKAAVNASGFFVQDRIVDGKPAGYTLTLGRNLYEAVNSVIILEKCAEIALKSRVIGGCKPGSKFAAKQTRMKYLDSYSAAEAEVRAAEMKADSKVKAEVSDEVDELEDYEKEFYGIMEEEPAEEAAAVQEAAEETVEEIMEELAEAEEAEVSPWNEAETAARKTLVEYGNKLVETGLVQGTWGNLSIRLDREYMLVTPSGLDYSRLTPSDMVKVNMNTMKHEGSLKPTSEKGLHAAIYKLRPDLGAIVHTHSRYCSIFAAAHQDLTVENPEAQKVFGTSVSLAKYAKAGTDKLAKFTAAAVGSNFGALMSNHGMTACGADMETAFKNAQLLEQAAEEYIESRWK